MGFVATINFVGVWGVYGRVCIGLARNGGVEGVWICFEYLTGQHTGFSIDTVCKDILVTYQVLFQI